MAISTTSLGNYTTQISISGEQKSNNFVAALDAAIVAGGWQQHDVSHEFSRVYKCLNKDGVTFKLFHVKIDKVAKMIYTTSYESWDNVNHVGMNEVWTNNNAGCMGYALSDCDVIVMISDRWLILQTFIRNEMSPWSGVIEIARDAAENTVESGLPCWIWTSSVTSMQHGRMASLPRSVSGATGERASADSWQIPYGRITSGAQLPEYIEYPWDPNKKIVHAARPALGKTEMHGRMFGMKMTYNVGASYNRISLPIDDDYFYSSDGVAEEHWVLAANPTYYNTFFSQDGGTSGGTSIASVPTSSTVTCSVACGPYFYYSDSSGIHKIDASWSQPLAPVKLQDSLGWQILKMVYDGYRYIYCGTSASIVRVDTVNDSISTLNIPSGSGSLIWDEEFLWSVPYGYSASNTAVSKIDPVTFTVLETLTVTIASANLPITACMDLDGCLYLMNSLGSSIIQNVNGSIYKFDPKTKVTTLLAGTTMNLGQLNCAGLGFDGSNLKQLISHSSTNFTMMRQISTSGTVIARSTHNASYTSLSTPTYNRRVFKLGLFDAGEIPATQASLLLSQKYENGATLYHSAPVYSFKLIDFDGNRMWYVSDNRFHVMSNLFHGDLGNTAFGRFLLPK